MAGEKNSALDLDLQAVENIPRDTLVALLRRKDKELKTQQGKIGKIEKLEERYVKVVRFNKILMEDRQSFQRFCHELLPECDGAFEEAALQETPTDLQELLRQLGEWRSHSDAARDDRKVFQQFLELCFPGDESFAKLFARPNLGEGAFDLLQKKWMELEDLHNQSIASINAMAREQAVLQQEDLQQAQQAQREAEKKLQAQSMHKLFDLLEDFVPAFLETVVASDLGIFQELEGFHYSPVERNTCVSIHCFLDKLQEQFACVRHATLLYNAHLVYTNLPLDDMRVLYSYLVAFNGAVSSQKLNKPPFGRIPTAASQPGGGSSSFGRAFLLTEEEDFLMGMSRRAPNGPPSIFVPAVHLNDGVGQLVALTYKSIMLVLILDEDVHVDARLLESLRDSCTAASGDGLSLAELQPLIVPQYKEIMEQEDEYRFVYYNHTNHALRLSNQASMSRSLLRTTGVTSLGPKAAEKPLLTPLHATLADPKLKCREVSWKSADRGWICAKRWCDREFYLLLDGTSTSLSRCQEECARFASIHFSNIVMM